METTITIFAVNTEDGVDFCNILADTYLAWIADFGANKTELKGADNGRDYTNNISVTHESEELVAKLEYERGIHRFVRVSPFDPQGRRYTLFVGVGVNGASTEDMVRSYVFHPHKIVRDERTGQTVSDDPADFLFMKGN